MRQTLNQRRNIDTLEIGAQKELVQKEGTFTSISNSEYHTFSIRQLFVVEWQMQSVDSKQLNDKDVKSRVSST
jgi:hypothetical protein